VRVPRVGLNEQSEDRQMVSLTCGAPSMVPVASIKLTMAFVWFLRVAKFETAPAGTVLLTIFGSCRRQPAF